MKYVICMIKYNMKCITRVVICFIILYVLISYKTRELTSPVTRNCDRRELNFNVKSIGRYLFSFFFY